MGTYTNVSEMSNLLYLAIGFCSLQEQFQITDGRERAVTMPNAAAAAQAHMLAHTLARNADPKFQVY